MHRCCNARVFGHRAGLQCPSYLKIELVVRHVGNSHVCDSGSLYVCNNFWNFPIFYQKRSFNLLLVSDSFLIKFLSFPRQFLNIFKQPLMRHLPALCEARWSRSLTFSQNAFFLRKEFLFVRQIMSEHALESCFFYRWRSNLTFSLPLFE